MKTETNKVWMAAVAAGVAAATLLGGAAGAAEQTLKVVTFAPPDKNHSSMVMYRRYIKRVNKAGKGLVKLDHIGGPSVVPLRDQTLTRSVPALSTNWASMSSAICGMLKPSLRWRRLSSELVAAKNG